MRALLAHLLLRAADRKAGQIGGDEEGRDPLRARPAGPRHHGEQRRLVGIGDEALGAGQAVDVAVAHRLGLDRRAVGARARLGQREAGDDLAARDARQPFGLLRGAARHHQPLAADPDIGAEHRAEGGRGPAEFERDPHLLGHGQAEPAIFLGDRQAEQPHRAHLAHHRLGHRIVAVDLRLQRPQPLRDEAADGVDQSVEGFGIEGHGQGLPPPLQGRGWGG